MVHATTVEKCQELEDQKRQSEVKCLVLAVALLM